MRTLNQAFECFHGQEKDYPCAQIIVHLGSLYFEDDNLSKPFKGVVLFFRVKTGEIIT
jgi:hypothetical protein